MRLLLDTHVILWWLLDDPGLSDAVKDRIESDAEVYVSVASAWELAIKQATGKLSAPVDIVQAVGGSGLVHLPIRFDHAVVAGNLPPIHKDPFDRMLIAQATCEGLKLLTRDAQILKYDVEVEQV
ncbi:MAG TPA: type II toxin-antitoxin system VapC family toxin [Candidatus Limnocylindrales bacterium]